MIKAGIANLWFVTLHPFDDGNGRIARAVADVLLARAQGNSQHRLYSLSAQIQHEQKDYYAVAGADTAPRQRHKWLAWFFATLGHAIEGAQSNVDAVLTKTHFWQHWNGASLNCHQVKLINRLLDGFEGKLTSSSWAATAKCSQDTALRDITALLKLGIIKRCAGGGRDTGYKLIWAENVGP